MRMAGLTLNGVVKRFGASIAVDGVDLAVTMDYRDNRFNVAGYVYDAIYTEREAIRQLPLFPTIGVKYNF
jgi:hypothetical protein